MKKNYFLAAAVVAAVLSGCSQDELADYSPEVKSNFTATLEKVESRTVLDDNNKVQWVVNEDSLSLFEKVNINAKYKVSGVDNNGTATLQYISHIENENYSSLGKYYAVYPYSDNNSIDSEGTITAQVPAAYTFKDKESCIASALMVASSDNKAMRFTNAQGIIRLRINAVTPYTWGKIQSVTFTSKANYLNGTATMSWDTTTPSAKISSGQEANKTLTINLDESLKKDLPSKQSGNYAEYYVPVVPTTFEAEDLTMVVTFANNKTYSKAIPADFTVGRKEIIGLKHSIGADDFTADIEDEVVSDEISSPELLIKALKAGGKFTLTADITLSEAAEIPEGKTVELNLNDKTLSLGENYIVNKGTLTVDNGSIIADTFNDETSGAPLSNLGGTLTIKDGASITGICAAVRNEGNTTIDGGTLTATCTLGYTSRIIYNKSGNVTINGGTFDGCHSTNPSEGCAIVSGNGETVVNGGYFTDFSCTPDAIFGYQTNTTVMGGTYAFVPYDGWTAEQSFTKNGYLAKGYSVVNNGNGTYTIMKGDVAVSNTDALITAIKNGETNIALAAGNYDMPIGTDYVSLQGKTLTINGTKDVIINTANVDMNDQYVTGANLTFDGVTLNFGTANYMGFANTANLTYKNCDINGLQFVCGTGKVVFENCDLNSNGAEHSLWTWGISEISFTGCDFTYADRAINCYAEHGQTTNATFTNCTFTKVEGEETTGAIETNSSLMTALNLSINNCTVNEGDLWWVSTWDSKNGANTTVTIDGKTLVTPDNIASFTPVSNTTYALTGDFANANVSIAMAEGVENVVFDGENATNINELIINQDNKLIGNASAVVGERSGKVTIQNFNVASQIDVFACKTEVVVQKNKAEALMIHAGNCDVKVLNNTLDANFKSHQSYINANATWGNANEYGIALNIFEYNLWLDGNTVTDAIGHAIGINGWEGTYDTGKDNVIESFKSNIIAVNSTTKYKRAAFKVWDDETYASNDEDINAVNETAQAFINAVLADGSNTFNITEGYDHTIFCFYNVNTNN